MRSPPASDPPAPERLLPSTQVTLTALLPVLLPLGVLLAQYLVWDLIQPYAWSGFLPVVAVCGWLSGLRGGLLSVLMSVAGAEWLLTYASDAQNPLGLEARIFSSLVFTGLAGAAVILLDQVHRERTRLHRAVVDLHATLLDGELARPATWSPWQRHFSLDLAAIRAVGRELAVRRECANAIPVPFATFTAEGRCLFANQAFMQAVQLGREDWRGRNALDPSHFPGTGLSSALRRLQDEAAPRLPVSVPIAGWGECQLIWVMTVEGGVALLAPRLGAGGSLEPAVAAAPARVAQAAPAGAPQRLPAAAPVPSARPASAAPAAPAAAPAAPAIAAPAAPRVAAVRSASGLRCLVVDDQEMNRELLREILRIDGAVPVCVGSGREALAMVSERPEVFDVVLMDLQMPGMDGYASARAIRSVVDSITLPILAITADGPGVPLGRLRDAGIQGLLHKPLDVSEMLRLLTEAGSSRAGAAY